MKFITSMFVLFFILLSFASAQENESLDEQLRNYLQHDFFSLNVLVQSEGRYSFQDDNFQGGRTFNAANGRISLRGNLDDGFFYRVFVDIAPRPILMDAFVGYKFDDSFQFSIGAMKPEQTLDFIPNPGAHKFVDRTNMTGLLVGSREIGIAASGDLGNFYYYTGLFNGNGNNSNNNNKFYGIGRLQYTITDAIPGYLQLAVSGSHGDSEGNVSGSRGPLLRGQRTIIGTDAELEWNRFYFATEYLRGELETVDFPDTNEIISGYYFTAGYNVTENFMLLGRYHSWSYKELDTTESKVTLGANIDFTDIVGLVVNLDAYSPDTGDMQYGASFIMQVQF